MSSTLFLEGKAYKKSIFRGGRGSFFFDLLIKGVFAIDENPSIRIAMVAKKNPIFISFTSPNRNLGAMLRGTDRVEYQRRHQIDRETASQCGIIFSLLFSNRI